MPDIFLGSSPHTGTSASTSKIMGAVLAALAPAAVFGVVIYGLPALWVILAATAASTGGEALFRLVLGRENRSGDLSAVVTGLLLALSLPPGTPPWMAALGAFFAVVVAKEFFGGIGANVFNPALSGRAFLLMSFPAAITSWTVPGRAWGAADAVSGATPLAIAKMGSGTAGVAANFFETGLSSGETYPDMIKTLFTGNHGGSIGESSILLILAGCFYLLVTKVIDWRAPLAMMVSAAVLSFVLGIDPLFSVLSGGLCFGAVFMATDYTTSPLTAKGKFIFGAGAGIVILLIRKWGGYPEGVTYGILIMNAITPFLNRLIQKKYGFVKRRKPAASGAQPSSMAGASGTARAAGKGAAK
ncbi:MAG: RnfABCDGE type electron transport complex subunit D [Treponema sp.]|jgi:electron transport complex protein RnfD|nr:RnfABCDGE type electron transport complex subunit D [Treponema sp.]